VEQKPLACLMNKRAKKHVSNCYSKVFDTGWLWLTLSLNKFLTIMFILEPDSQQNLKGLFQGGRIL
jgi:superoxide dismutase